MKKYVDYSREKAATDRLFTEQCRQKNIPQKEQLQSLIGRLIATERNRSNLANDETRTTRVTEDYYKHLCHLAMTNGGRVELDWDERHNLATLIYFGKELVLDADFSSEPKNISAIFADSDTINISAEGNYFRILLSFDLTSPTCP